MTLLRRHGPRRDTPSMRAVLVPGALSLLAVALFFWVGLRAFNGVPGKAYTTMYVEVPQTGNVLRHDPVRIAGVRVGQVETRELAPDGLGRLKLQLNPGVTLPVGTRVRIRANGLLGARYIQLLPSRNPTMLRANSTIRGNADALTFGVPETLDTLDAPTRAALGSTFDNVSRGLLGHGRQLNLTLHLIGQNIPAFRSVVHAILRRPGAARRLLPSLNAAMGSLSANRSEIAQLPATGSAVLEAFIAEEHAVQGTLEAAPPTLSAATTGLSNGNRLLASLTRLSVEVERTLPPAPAALRSTAALLRESHAPLGQARSLLEQARPAIPALLRITGAASPVLGPLRRGLATAAPMLDQVGRYGCDIKNFGAVFRSMTGFGGVGDGPNGAPGEFRVQVGLAGFGQTLGVGAADDPTAVRDTYAPPCRYPDTVYGLRSR